MKVDVEDGYRWVRKLYSDGRWLKPDKYVLNERKVHRRESRCRRQRKMFCWSHYEACWWKNSLVGVHFGSSAGVRLIGVSVRQKRSRLCLSIRSESAAEWRGWRTERIWKYRWRSLSGQDSIRCHENGEKRYSMRKLRSENRMMVSKRSTEAVCALHMVITRSHGSARVL